MGLLFQAAQEAEERLRRAKRRAAVVREEAIVNFMVGYGVHHLRLADFFIRTLVEKCAGVFFD